MGTWDGNPGKRVAREVNAAGCGVEALERRALLSAAMVADINTIGADVQFRGAPSASYVEINGTLFFMFDDGSSGSGLWKTDGTPARTRIVKNIGTSSERQALANVNGLLYFGGGGGALWKTDGTDAGTVLITKISP